MKRVKLKRACTLRFKDEEIDDLKCGQVGEVPEEFAEKHPDWFADPDEAEPADFAEMTVEWLRDELRDRGLKVSGTKDELVERLENA